MVIISIKMITFVYKQIDHVAVSTNLFNPFLIAHAAHVIPDL